MLGKLFGRRFGAQTSAPSTRIPEGQRVYAIGDINGRADLLRQLHDGIGADLANAEPAETTIIYLGDYVDRGLESRQVIDQLLANPVAGVNSVFLLGNHEAMLQGFRNGVREGMNWLYNGGNATLHSYGVRPPQGARGDQDLEEARAAFLEQLPATHAQFFDDLRVCHEVGDYFFAHAGVQPGVPLHLQTQEDMIWIRNEFLNSRQDFGKIIVHGHSITPEIEETANRIGIDTGAYITGTLTALALEGGERRYLST
ncbi:MAG: metallophosphoesterase family protein [Alphaproteobacteria bacterium]|nr:metallophosphoesterase family protein [Alphaproteobacteria bacterium]MDP6566038.1 metallophosphoesterase family protein [Alphaproteobacteria bacterium]